MKFGLNLRRLQIAEWDNFYLNYNGLKTLIKTTAAEAGDDVDFTGLRTAVGHNVEQVKSFYHEKYTLLQRRATELQNRYEIALNLPDPAGFKKLDPKELEDFLETAIELRDKLRQLRWYWEVNLYGVQRLSRKLYRLPSQRDEHSHEDESFGMQSAEQPQCLRDLARIEDLIATLNDINRLQPSGSAQVPFTLVSFCVRLDPSLTLISPNTLRDAILADDTSILTKIQQAVISKEKGSGADMDAWLGVLLRCSISQGSKTCIDMLISQSKDQNDDSFENASHFIHRLVIAIGRELRAETRRDKNTKLEKPAGSVKRDCGFLELLKYALDHLGHSQRDMLGKRDSTGRLPLHYAAQYGSAETTEMILGCMRDWGRYLASTSVQVILSEDSEGYSPMHLAVLGGHTAVTRILLEQYRPEKLEAKAENVQQLHTTLGNLLTIALKSGFTEIVQLLISFKAGIKYQNRLGETIIYIVASSGSEDYLKLLIETGAYQKADWNTTEKVYGRSPLSIACIEGHLSIVDLLLQIGADHRNCDLRGWTAKDHAAFRGHIKVAKKLEELKDHSSGSSKGDSPTGKLGSRFANREKRDMDSSLDAPEAKAESRVIINLGSLDSRNDIEAITLTQTSTDAHGQQCQAGLSMEICGIDGTRSSKAILQLPILGDTTNEPLQFSVQNLSDFKLMFKFFRTSNNNEKGVLVGSGIVLLSSLRSGLGSKRESLVSHHTIPILEKETLNLFGTVTFTPLVVTPFTPPNLLSIEKGKIERKGHTKVVGHRGFGQNLLTRKHLQLGENTIQSFDSAINLGASLVEFDVQLTKDYVPVVYHDFLMNETGLDSPIHTLSFEQFMHVTKSQSSRGDLPSAAEVRYLERSNGPNDRRPRARSLNAYEDSRAKDLYGRMKHTFDFNLNGFKGNTIGTFVQEPYTTLEALLTKLPMWVGFDIEIKYPMLYEADYWEMDTYAIELNTFVDAILNKTYTFSKGREIIFTSFSPEVCILLSIKQSDFPILFLNDSGNWPAFDTRASSLQEAIHFAEKWNLQGIVMASEPFVMCPRLVKHARDMGMVTASYGGWNNDPDKAQIQADAGLDYIVVDEVPLIAKRLNPTESS